MSIPANTTGTFAEVPIEPIDPLISIQVGEIIYNLRAALDYIVYELARSDSGKVQVGTQFPIDDHKKAFNDHRKQRLRGIAPKHVTMIESLQPYNGCTWTGLLRDLSNRDKHRHLVAIRRVATVRTPITQAFVAFEKNGTPIIGALQILAKEVAQTVKLFEPLIK